MTNYLEQVEAIKQSVREILTDDTITPHETCDVLEELQEHIQRVIDALLEDV